MARNDDLDVGVDDELARGDPVAHRPGPYDRMALDKQNIAGVHDPIFDHLREYVAARVCGTDFDQTDGLAPDANVQAALEGPRRHRDVDTLQVELRADLGKEFSRLSHRARVALHFGEAAGAAVVSHLLRA